MATVEKLDASKKQSRVIRVLTIALLGSLGPKRMREILLTPPSKAGMFAMPREAAAEVATKQLGKFLWSCTTAAFDLDFFPIRSVAEIVRASKGVGLESDQSFALRMFHLNHTLGYTDRAKYPTQEQIASALAAQGLTAPGNLAVAIADDKLWDELFDAFYGGDACTPKGATRVHDVLEWFI